MDEGHILETLKSSFIFNFRTGSPILDTFFTGLIIYLSTYLMSLTHKLQEIDFRAILNFWNQHKSAKIIISGKKLEGIHNTRLEYSTNFFALLHKIKQLKCDVAEIFEMSEIPIQERDDGDEYNDWDSDDEDMDRKDDVQRRGLGTNLIVSQSGSFKLTDDIYSCVNISSESREDSNNKSMMKTEEFAITIYSHKLTVDDLRKQLKVWVKEYEKHMVADKHLKYFLYSPTGDADEDYYDATRHYSEFLFESGKSFSNVFYPEKEDVMKRIDFFTENKDWYKKRGIPYTMGFLFYGAPGCGKTSTIKAIANHTQRHIVSVPLNRIKTCKELLNIFYNTRMNHKEIPLNKRLYVLEDIDCADLKDLVGDRDAKEKESATESESDKDKDKTKEDPDQMLLNLLKVPTVSFDKKGQKLTLAALLEVLDGVMEMDGRMLIITTNYPEKLDRALIRPGRIDMKVKFGKCTVDSLVSMYEHCFEASIPTDFDKSKLVPDKWTPAEATQIFLNNMHSPEKSLEELIHMEPDRIHEE